MGKQVKLLLRHKQQDFGPQTSMDQGGINAPLMSVELATIGQVVVALANCIMYSQIWQKIKNHRKKYTRLYHDTC